ncbi:MAG: DNA repair protein RecO [Kocuria sp.]|nr:DNA repair protein RecO [Kocuria sp.]
MPRGGSFTARSYRDMGVVLRTYPLGEADRIVVLLTREHGQVRAVAKGVRRTSSRFGARLEPFNLSDLQLVHGRTLDVVSQAIGRKGWASPIAADYGKFTAAAAVVEAAEQITDNDDSESSQHYQLVAGALSAIARGLHDSAAIMDSYLIRAISVAGWAPSLTDCALCRRTGPHSWFSSASGGVVCDLCRPPGALAPEPEVLKYVEALLHGWWEHIDTAASRVAGAAGRIVADYVQFHLERTVRALALVERN